MSRTYTLLTATALSTLALAATHAQEVILQTTTAVPTRTMQETVITTTHTQPDGSYATATEKQVEVSVQPQFRVSQQVFPDSVAGITATQPDYSTLNGMLAATGLNVSLAGTPYTAFLPTNSSFNEMVGSYAKILSKPTENRDLIGKILNYHIVPQKVTYAQLQQMVSGASNGKVRLRTLAGDSLYVTQDAQGLIISDVRGMSSRIAPEPGLPEAYPSSVFRIGALFVPL